MSEKLKEKHAWKVSFDLPEHNKIHIVICYYCCHDLRM